jgi:hypothetical protein
MRRRLSFVLALATVFVPVTARAQASRAAAALVLAEGTVYLNDQPVAEGAAASALPDAAVVRAEKGRAVIALKRGGWLFLDTGASVRVAANTLYNFNRIDVLAGSAIVMSVTSAPIVECGSSVRLSNAGVFRFDAQPVTATGEHPCAFRVFEGAAAVPLATVTNALRAGQKMTCNRRCGDMIPTLQFSPDALDEFDLWSRQARGRLGGDDE